MPPQRSTPCAARPRPILGAAPLLVALLLVLLQVSTPLAHAMLHLSAAWPDRSSTAGAHHVRSATPETVGWSAAAEAEQPCPLCTTDHLPALPGAAAILVMLHTARADWPGPCASARSSAPLDVFCRPPPLRG